MQTSYLINTSTGEPESAPCCPEGSTASVYKWVRALSLAERTAAPETLPAYPFPAIEDHRRLAGSKLQQWKEQPAFNDYSLFQRKLGSEQLTEDTMLFLLSESDSELQERLGNPPNWAKEIARLLEEQDSATPPPADLLNRFDSIHGGAFLKLAFLFIKPGMDRLEAGVAALRAKYAETAIPVDAHQIYLLFLPNLIPALVPRLSRTVALEVNVSRMKKELQGASPESRFSEFLCNLNRRSKMVDLMHEYPVLARQLTIAVDNWVAAELELLDRLCCDWRRICSAFSPGRDVGVLVEAAGDLGDSHAGGRSVHRLRFSSGLQLIYKPKPLGVDVHFQEFLSWLNQQKRLPEFRVLTVLDQGEYGWTECVSTSDCACPEEIERFYERQGCFLALLNVLEATDFHCENLIAAGEHPVLVDLEALFHPKIEINDLETSGNRAAQDLITSVLRVGLLPECLQGQQQPGLADASGLGGGRPGGISHPVPAWDGFGTDEMRIVRKRIVLAGAENLPKLSGTHVEVLDYAESVIQGFRAMYLFLLEHSEKVLAGPVERFRTDQVRVVVRATKTYANILRQSFHPDLLRDALERDRFFDALWVGVEQRPYLAHLISAERSDLEAGDIPIFTCAVNGRDIQASRHYCIPNFLQESSFDSVGKRFRNLNLHDLEQQLWLIRSALVAGSLGDPGSAWKSSELVTPQTGASEELLLRHARSVGDRLSQLAFLNEGSANWVGLTMADDRDWQISPFNSDLYNGTSGIVLFLAYLGKVTADESYTKLAKSGLLTTRAQLSRSRESETPLSLGAFDGICSIIYVLSHLGRLWDEPKLIAEANDLVDLLPPLIRNDQNFDVISGSAGCINSLLALHEVSRSSQALEAARACGMHLLSHTSTVGNGVGWIQEPASRFPLTGLSHGAAGIALSLFRLASVSEEDCFRQVAEAALRYERATFSLENGNWPDFRNIAGTTLDSLPSASVKSSAGRVSWCHGAAGLGMARLACLRLGADSRMHEEVDVALQTTLDRGFGMNHSLCHGDLGNLELLLLAAREGGRAAARDQCVQISAKVIGSIERQGWCTGIPLGAESPGLMVGLAGIGYQLLRLARPDRVPSVLLLDPPIPNS